MQTNFSLRPYTKLTSLSPRDPYIYYILKSSKRTASQSSNSTRAAYAVTHQLVNEILFVIVRDSDHYHDRHTIEQLPHFLCFLDQSVLFYTGYLYSSIIKKAV